MTAERPYSGRQARPATHRPESPGTAGANAADQRGGGASSEAPGPSSSLARTSRERARDRNDRAERFLPPARPVGPVRGPGRSGIGRSGDVEPAPRSALSRLASLVATAPITRQAVSFGIVGVVSTLAYIALYAALRPWLSAAAANALSLLVTAIGNTEANRRLTFGVQGRDGLARDHAAGLAAFAIALAITTASLGGLHLVSRNPSRLVEVAVLISANVAATLVRFALLRLALDRRRQALDRGRTASARPLIAPERIVP